MKGFFLPEGTQTKLMIGDNIVFSHNGYNLETIDFYRGDVRLFLEPPPHSHIGGSNEYPRYLVQAERIKIAKLIAAAIGAELRVIELGGKRTVFQFI